MATFRVNKNENYTVMSNYHLKDGRLSLKAKGMMSVMLSLPDEWDYSINGLVAICKENVTAIRSTLNELKEYGYLEVNKLYPGETKTGRIEYVYDIYEKAKEVVEKQDIEKQDIENVDVENEDIEKHLQLNTNILNTNNNIYIKEDEKKEEKKEEKKVKKKYGEYKHVLLTDEEVEKLKGKYENYEELIKYLDEYIEMKGYKAKSHYLCILHWVVDAVNKNSKKNPVYDIFMKKNNPKNQYTNTTQKEFDDLEKFYSN